MNRFDYVKFDEIAISQQAMFKDAYLKIAESIEKLYLGRAATLALDELEQSYMWLGKQIRDDQIARK